MCRAGQESLRGGYGSRVVQQEGGLDSEEGKICLLDQDTNTIALITTLLGEVPMAGPGYHGCGSIKGKKEKFPKRKEKKRKGGIS